MVTITDKSGSQFALRCDATEESGKSAASGIPTDADSHPAFIRRPKTCSCFLAGLLGTSVRQNAFVGRQK